MMVIWLKQRNNWKGRSKQVEVVRLMKAGHDWRKNSLHGGVGGTGNQERKEGMAEEEK